MGNFIFDYKKKYQKGLWTQGYAVMFNISEYNVDFELIPYNQGKAENYKLSLLGENDKAIFNEDIKRLNNIIQNDDLFKNEWKKYLKTQEKYYKGMLLLQNKYINAAIVRGLLPPIFFHSKSHQLLLLNLLRCESHREIITNTLENNLLK